MPAFLTPSSPFGLMWRSGVEIGSLIRSLAWLLPTFLPSQATLAAPVLRSKTEPEELSEELIKNWGTLRGPFLTPEGAFYDPEGTF